MLPPEIEYKREYSLNADEFIDVLNRSTLGERRPVNDMERIKDMCQNANLIVTARSNGKLVGIARSLSDFAFCTYLSDLAVDEQYQKMGIGVRLILIAAPAAVNYYPKTGMTRHENCFLLDKLEDLKIK
jgi:ribosomal protein S18 acetylase RimI-like enzyme